MVGGSAIVAINNARQTDSLGALICSETERIVGSLDVELQPGLRSIQFPTLSLDGFGSIELPVVRVVDTDNVTRELLQVDPGDLPIVQTLQVFRPPLASH